MYVKRGQTSADSVDFLLKALITQTLPKVVKGRLLWRLSGIVAKEREKAPVDLRSLGLLRCWSAVFQNLSPAWASVKMQARLKSLPDLGTFG